MALINGIFCDRYKPKEFIRAIETDDRETNTILKPGFVGGFDE